MLESEGFWLQKEREMVTHGSVVKGRRGGDECGAFGLGEWNEGRKIRG